MNIAHERLNAKNVDLEKGCASPYSMLVETTQELHKDSPDILEEILQGLRDAVGEPCVMNSDKKDTYD